VPGNSKSVDSSSKGDGRFEFDPQSAQYSDPPNFARDMDAPGEKKLVHSGLKNVVPAASQSSGGSQRRSGEEGVSSGADMGAGSVSATCQNAAPVTGDINSDEVNGERWGDDLARRLGSTASWGAGQGQSQRARAGVPSESRGAEVDRAKGLWGWALTNAPAVLDRL
jgi:hypothetical protein